MSFELDQYRRTVGQNLRSHRHRNGKSLRELANEVSISRSKLSEIERGSSTASHRDLIEISAALNIPFEWLTTTDEKTAMFQKLSERLADGQLEQAAKIADWLIEHADSAQERAYSYQAAGKVALRQRNYHLALSYWTDMLLSSVKTRDKHLLHLSHIKLAIAYYYLSQWNDCLFHCNRSLEYTADARRRNKVYKLLANVLFKRQELDAALEIYLQLRAWHQEKRNRFMLARIHYRIGQIFVKKEMPSEAIYHFQTAFSIQKQFKDDEALTETAKELSSIYISSGDFSSAREVLTLVLDRCEKLQDGALLLYRLSLCESGGKSKELLLKAVQALKHSGETDKQLSIQIYQSIAYTYEMEGSYQQAMEYYKHAFLSFRIDDDKRNAESTYERIRLHD